MKPSMTLNGRSEIALIRINTSRMKKPAPIVSCSSGMGQIKHQYLFDGGARPTL
jgi:hypothetical protein